MKQNLTNNWDWGIAKSEFFSSFILLFLVMIFLTSLKKKFMPIAFGVATLFAIVFGWSIGAHDYKSIGFGFSFITPVSAVLMSFHENSFNALWYILLFQLLGSVLGFLLFLLYKKFLLSKKEDTNTEEKAPSLKIVLAKSLIFQPILIFSLLYIPNLPGTYDTGWLLNAVITSLAIGFILFITKDFGFILFSPWISLAALLSNGFNFKKNKLRKTLIINLALEQLIQIGFIAIIISVDIFVFKGLTN